MLLIDTYLAESKIPGAGLGLFCRQRIAAGTIIWEFTGGFDYIIKYLPANPLHKAFVRKYGYRPIQDPNHWVMCADDARFFNHSDNPTCLDLGDYTTARFDLEPGTELTSDYRTFCSEPFSGFVPAE